MDFVKINQYIRQIDSLIRHEHTGTAEEFAEKLGISERTLQNYLQQLREIGVDIAYDYYNKTYKYTQKGRIYFGFSPDEMNRIKGGLYITQYTPLILDPLL